MTGADPTRRTRSPPGGPAALAGFLYQLLGSADWAVRARFQTADGRAHRPPLLILEPAGGGDARHGTEAVQYKRRGRPWSVTDLVKEVFPDLFRAVADEAVTRTSLQTDAGYANVAALRALGQALAEGELEGALERARRQGLRLAFGRRRSLTPAAFFAQAGAWAAGVPVAAFRRDAALRAQFRRLLTTLELSPPRTLEELREAVVAQLRPMIPYPEEATRAANALLARMAFEAMRGEAAFDVDAFLAEEGVLPGAAGDAAAFARNLRDAFQTAMTRLDYTEAADCREAAALQPSARPIAFSGASGAGKTWLLARAASAAARRGAHVIWIENLTSMGDARRRVAGAVQAARGVTRPIVPDAVGQVLDALGANDLADLVVCLDRFTDPQTALRILRDGWWADEGAKVMAALPACDPDAVRTDDVDLVAAPVFTPSEVRRLLRGRRLAWAALPSDVRRLLERPLMARLYQGLARPSDEGFIPSNEYELMSAVWRRAPADAHQGVWRGAMAKLRTRIDAYREALQGPGSPLYPWPMAEAGWTSEERDVLERQGVLRWADESHVQVDHDRLLAWGLAESAAAAWRRRALTVDTLAALLDRCGARPDETTPSGGTALGYVLADFLWLVLQPDEEPHADLLQVLQRLRRRGREGLSWDMLATLGQRGFRLILRMSELWDDATLGPLSAVGHALSTCEARPPSAGDAARIAQLLDRADRCELAAAYLTRKPASARVRRLIQLRADYHGPWPEQGRFNPWWARRESLFAAAEACALAVPPTFIALLPRLSNPNEIAVAAWVAAELPPEEALAAWRQLRPVVTQDLVGLTAQFAGLDLDTAGEELLKQHAATDAGVFAALARVRPAVALARVQDQPRAGLAQLDELLRGHPEAIAVVLERFASGDLAAEDLALAALSWPTWVSRDLADALIDTHAPAAKADRTLQLLADAPSLGVITALEGRAGSNLLEHAVLDDALTRSAAHHDRNRDLELGHASAILLRIGGHGFQTLTAARLRHPFELENRDGLDAALVAAGPEVVPALVEHARSVLEAARGAAIPSRPFHVLAAVAPDVARDLAVELLAAGGREEVWIAAEIALQTSDAELGRAALPRFGEASLEEAIFQLRLLDLVDEEPQRRAVLARHLMSAGDSHARLYAAWAAARLQDGALLAEVADDLIPRLNSSYDSADLQSATLLLETELAPRLLAALTGPHIRRQLRSTRAGLGSEALDAATSNIDDDLRDATALEDSFLNIPREGLSRLWRADADAAFEVFEEGLRRGGRTSEGAAAAAVKVDGGRALDIVLQRLAHVTEGKARSDAGRAARAFSDAAAAVSARLSAPDDLDLLSAIEVAGWLAEPALDFRLDALLRRETRRAFRKALHAALDRSARIGFLRQIDARIGGTADPDTRRRLLAVALQADVDGVLSKRDDPLFVGRWLETDRDHLLVSAWTRR